MWDKATQDKLAAIHKKNAALKAPRKKTWTVMVFMGVTDYAGRQDLRSAAKDDLAEIEAVGGGGSHGLNIFVQQNFGRGKKAVRTHFFAETDMVDPADGIKKKMKRLDDKVADDEADYRDGNALSAFVCDSLCRAGHREDDFSLLVLWGHAYDFTFGQLLGPGGGSNTALNFTAIGDVLERVQVDAKAVMSPGVKGGPLPKLDILGFDACDIATAEVAYQLRDVAKFLLASQIGVPMPGWPYHLILDRIRKPRGSEPISPPELGSYAVRRYCGSYEATAAVSLTMLNLCHTEELFRLTQGVAVELAMAISNPEMCERMARTFARSQTELGKPFVDVADLCLSLLDEVEYPGLVEKARALGDIVAQSRPEVVENADDPRNWSLVVDHDRNSGELVRLNGVSLYAPNVAPPRDLDGVAALYRQLDFVKNGRWSGVAHQLATQ